MRIAKFGLLAVFSALLAGSLRADDSNVYRITHVEGRVAVVPKGGTDLSPATLQFPLEPGDRVLTGDDGRAEIASKDGTIMELSNRATLELQDVSDSVAHFFLKVGRMLAKFRSQQDTGRGYMVKTPVAVAAIRGTELAIDVKEDGELQAGVVEGKVAVQSLEDPVAEEVVMESLQGATVTPTGKASRLDQIPPALAPAIPRFAHIRERVPKIQVEWKDLDPPTRRKMRQESLRERVKWNAPEKLKRGPRPGTPGSEEKR